MKREVVSVAIFAVLGAAFAPSVLAHPGAHGLKVGEVVSISGDTFDLKTATETITVTLDLETKFEKETKPATRELLKKGARVGVAVSKPAAGKALVATRVVFGLKAPAAPKSR